MTDGTYYPTIVPATSLSHDWIPYEDRTSEGKYLTDEFHEQVGEWGDLGLSFGALPKRVLKEQDELDVCGEKLLRIYQTTGSCVGAGGLTAMIDTAIGDILARGDIEDPVIPFHLATYGVGRQLSGMRSKGDGSFGGGQAKAMAEFGFLYHDDVPGLPKPSASNGWMWYSKAIEYAWSHPSAWPSGMSLEAMREKAKPFGVGEFKRMRSAKDVKEARAARMGVTMACNFGTRGCKVVDGVLLAEWDGSWAHQQSVGGYDEHESLGDIFEINNQWKDAHGHCPLLFGKYGAFGSYWIRSATMDRICEKGEVYAFINTGGRKLTDVNWKNLGITYGTAA